MLGRLLTLPNLVWIRRAVETPSGGNLYGYYAFFSFLFCFCFFYSSTGLQPIPVNQFLRTIVHKTRSGIRKTLLGMRSSCEIVGVSPKKHPLNWVGQGNNQSK